METTIKERGILQFTALNMRKAFFEQLTPIKAKFPYDQIELGNFKGWVNNNYGEVDGFVTEVNGNLCYVRQIALLQILEGKLRAADPKESTSDQMHKAQDQAKKLKDNLLQIFIG